MPKSSYIRKLTPAPLPPGRQSGLQDQPLTPARILTTANGGRREGERSSPDLGDSPDLPADPPRPGRSAPASRMTCSRRPTRRHATAGSATTLTWLPLARNGHAAARGAGPHDLTQSLRHGAHNNQSGIAVPIVLSAVQADAERISRDGPDQRSSRCATSAARHRSPCRMDELGTWLAM